jgi:hypothetical protein
MKINRTIYKSIIDRMNSSKKVILIYGARQVGKTTLVKEILEEFSDKRILSINADQRKYIDLLSSRDLDKIASLIHGYDIVFIDEAQRIPEIGINSKLIVDSYPDLQLILTGSSSLDLAGKTKEPLTGRIWTFKLFPLSFSEMAAQYNPFDLQNKIESLLIYGSYPEVFTFENYQDKRILLSEIAESYLYKDILEIMDLKHPHKIHDLLRLLAYQIGSEVSIHEISTNLSLNQETVERYIHLLEESFVIFKLRGFSRNPRKEISKRDKIFFYDNGIRNAVIGDFKPLKERNDTGQLWENYIISERMKKTKYQGIPVSYYFWRTYTGVELDLVEEVESKLTGYEIKLSKARKKPPQAWIKDYQGDYFYINKDNFMEFIR